MRRLYFPSAPRKAPAKNPALNWPIGSAVDFGYKEKFRGGMVVGAAERPGVLRILTTRKLKKLEVEEWQERRFALQQRLFHIEEFSDERYQKPLERMQIIVQTLGQRQAYLERHGGRGSMRELQQIGAKLNYARQILGVLEAHGEVRMRHQLRQDRARTQAALNDHEAQRNPPLILHIRTENVTPPRPSAAPLRRKKGPNHQATILQLLRKRHASAQRGDEPRQRLLNALKANGFKRIPERMVESPTDNPKKLRFKFSRRLALYDRVSENAALMRDQVRSIRNEDPRAVNLAEQFDALVPFLNPLTYRPTWQGAVEANELTEARSMYNMRMLIVLERVVENPEMLLNPVDPDMALYVPFVLERLPIFLRRWQQMATSTHALSGNHGQRMLIEGVETFETARLWDPDAVSLYLASKTLDRWLERTRPIKTDWR